MTTSSPSFDNGTYYISNNKQLGHHTDDAQVPRTQNNARVRGGNRHCMDSGLGVSVSFNFLRDDIGFANWRFR